MEVLVYLAANPLMVVSKDELKSEVWNNSHVVDEAVGRCISQIRKGFRDDPRRPAFIETVPKRVIPGRSPLVPFSDQTGCVTQIMQCLGNRLLRRRQTKLGILIQGTRRIEFISKTGRSPTG